MLMEVWDYLIFMIHDIDFFYDPWQRTTNNQKRGIFFHSWKDSVPTKIPTVSKIIVEMKTKPQYLIIWYYIKLGSKPKMPRHLQIIVTFSPQISQQ